MQTEGNRRLVRSAEELKTTHFPEAGQHRRNRASGPNCPPSGAQASINLSSIQTIKPTLLPFQSLLGRMVANERNELFCQSPIIG